MPGTRVVDEYLDPNRKLYMYVSKKEKSSEIVLGGWATNQLYDSEEEMRDALALIKGFKSPEECCDVVEITLKSSVPARSGIAGPQTEFGKVYPGGARQYELLMNTKDTDLVEQTFEIKRLYRL